MEKKDSQSKQQRLQTKNKPVPFIRYNKKTEEWTMKAKYVDTPEEVKIEVNRKQLDAIAKLVAYSYHDLKEYYMDSSSDQRKVHIYNDLKEIDQWLTLQYNKIRDAKEEE